MNQNMVDFSARVQFQQSHGLNGDSNSEFGNSYCEYMDINQAWNMGSCSQTLAVAGGGGGAHQPPPPNQGPAKSSANIMSRFESPASAFYATERCMGFQVQQYDSQLGTNPSLTSQFSKMNDLDFPLYQSDPSFEFSNTLQAMVKSPLSSSNQYSKFPEKSNKFSYGNLATTKFLPIQQHSLFINDVASVKRNQDHTASAYNLHADQMSFSSSQQEKLTPSVTSEGSVSAVSGNQGSNGTAATSSSKTRIRWNQDLHDKFVECVNRLGGAEKATPKAILKLMDSDGLTIFHVKSHLQKYRIAKYMPDSAQGKSDKSPNVEAEDVHHLDTKTGLQLREALQLQLDLQRRLHEQLEIQRKLQLRIEEQGRQLKMMFDQQQKTSSDSLLNTQNLSNTANDNNDTSNIHKDVELSTSGGSGNSFFPSKIS